MNALRFEFIREKRPDIKGIALMAFATPEAPAEPFHEQAIDCFTESVRVDELKASAEPAFRTLEPDQGEDDDDRCDQERGTVRV